MGRRVAFRKKKQNRFAIILVAVAVLLILVTVRFKSMELQDKHDLYAAQKETLQQQIDAETQRAQDLKDYEIYTKTKKFAEEIARDKLGLIYEDEIIFKVE